MMKPWKSPPKVEIDWLDHASCSLGWQVKGEYLKHAVPLRMRTAGYLLQKNARTVTVVQNIDEQGKVNDAMTIVRSCITRMRRVH